MIALGGIVMKTTPENKSLLPSEQPRGELLTSLENYKKTNPNTFTFSIDQEDHVVITNIPLEEVAEWQEFEIPDFVWCFKPNVCTRWQNADPLQRYPLMDSRPSDFSKNTTKYIKLKLTGGKGLRSLEEMLLCNMKSVTHLDVSELEVGNVFTVHKMLYCCSQLQEVIGLERWNVSKVIDFGNMFAGCTHLTSIGNLSGWNMGYATFLDGMFSNCHSLQGISGIDRWQLAQVRTTEAMFYRCTQLHDVGDLATWRLTACQFLGYMFYHCRNLTTIGDIAQWYQGNKRKTFFMQALFDGSGIQFNDPRHILKAWSASLEQSDWVFKEQFYSLIYPKEKNVEKIDMENFMPDLRLHHEIVT